MSNFIYGIPVVGHVLGGGYWMFGMNSEAEKAFDAANRSTLVIAGGVGGALVAGPVGMVAGAVAAGTGADLSLSVINNKPEGVIRGMVGMVSDIRNGNVPITSAAITALYVAGDTVSGFTGGNIANNMMTEIGAGIIASMAHESGKKMGEEVLKEVVKEGAKNSFISSTTHTLADNIDTPSAGSGGGQPPRNNKNNYKSEHERDLPVAESHFEVFFKLFGENVTSLDDINIAGVYLFREITSGLSTDRGRKNSLKKLIIGLRLNGTIERVIRAVQSIFYRFDRSEITFQNFLYLSEMVATYVSENLARRHEMQQDHSIPFHQRRDQNLHFSIFQNLTRRSIYSIFEYLQIKIGPIWVKLKPTFGNIMTAITHYYKHKFVPASERILTVQEYFDLVEDMLSRAKKSGEYAELMAGSRRRLVYDVYRAEFGRRVRLVLQHQDGKVVVSSCHILDAIIKFDEKDGEEQYDPEY